MSVLPAAASTVGRRSPGRLVVRRIPDVHAEAHLAAGQDTLFDVYRFHVFFTSADNLTRAAGTLAPQTSHGQPPRVPHAHRRPCPDRDLRTKPEVAPPYGLAVGDRLDHPDHPSQRPTPTENRPDPQLSPTAPTPRSGTPWQRGQALHRRHDH
jgi:hypothetical protein